MPKPSRRLWPAVLVAAAAALPQPLHALTPAAPSRWVTDGAGVLSEGTRRTLDARLEAYEGASGHQVLVWIGRTTGGEPIEDFANRAFAGWRVGRKGMDDGLVLFLFSDDRKLRLEVGYGLESRLPDLAAGRIINETMVPRLRTGDFDGAVTAGIDAAIAAISGEAPAAAGAEEVPAKPKPQLTAGQKVLVGLLAIGFLILLITHPSFALWLLMNVVFSSRGGGSSGGGGGGFSGGGGSSGGGGASGSW